MFVHLVDVTGDILLLIVVLILNAVLRAVLLILSNGVLIIGLLTVYCFHN